MSSYSAVAALNSTAITSLLLPHKTNQNATLFNTISLSPYKIFSRRQSLHQLFSGNNGSLAIKRRFKPSSPVMEWQDCTAKMEVDVPCSVAYKCYSDREAIPRWMPFISSVKVLEDKPDLSRWSLKYKAFGRDIQFSWLAKNLQPIPNQKIHWRSLEGLPNRGVVRFYPKGPSSCMVELAFQLTVSYEVPQILAPVASVSSLIHDRPP
ncbi:hypothetical protein Sjap_007194 [Stephania japonica]|uniref:Coenzyme Q-binding protein COQ10 START domain-containing protein n=1 Tax=Stephania japonica TaxID=461633 RepID=A0AAP0PDG9_9MAGN